MWYDDLFSTVGEFAEGAWESVSTGAQNALGDWASGLGGEDGSPAANVNSGQDANQTTVANDQTKQTSKTAFSMDTKTMMIGGGVLLAAVLLLR